MILRDYQTAAVDAVYNHLRSRDDNPCVVIPTGGGKTPVIATICRDVVKRWGGRVCVVAHVKELLEQTADKLRAICPELEFGLYSAGLGQKNASKPVTVAGIQSIYKRGLDLDPFQIVIVDEAHLIPEGGDGMYRSFLNDCKIANPQMRCIGLTATPYRTGSGLICRKQHILNKICYEAEIHDLIEQGYLSRLTTSISRNAPDTSGVSIRGGEFVEYEANNLFGRHDVVASACREIIEATKDRKRVLIFASGISHGERVASELESLGQPCGFVTGDTLPVFRQTLLNNFRNGQMKYLANVNVLTTGFDAPDVDCVVLLRPTMSAGLYYQMVGRGFRIAPGKLDCLVLDFGGNIKRHGPVDRLRPKGRSPGGSGGGDPLSKICPGCDEESPLNADECEECGLLFPRKPEHDAKPTAEEILSKPAEFRTFPVVGITYSRHIKRNAPDAPPTMRVDYEIEPLADENLKVWKNTISEWVCIEHTGYAHRKAEQWWAKRSISPCPDTVEEAARIAEWGGIADTESITVKFQGKFPEIIEHQLGEIPEVWTEEADLEDIPF